MLLLLSQDEPGQGHAVGVDRLLLTHLADLVGRVELADPVDLADPE